MVLGWCRGLFLVFFGVGSASYVGFVGVLVCSLSSLFSC
jgi:hypothetical protein